MNKCENLKAFMSTQVDVINRHIDEHKWFQHIENKNDAVEDFLNKYGWLIRCMYCNYCCPYSNQCIIKNGM